MSKCEEIVKSAISKRAFYISCDAPKRRPYVDYLDQAEAELAPILEATIAQFFASKEPKPPLDDPGYVNQERHASPEVQPAVPCPPISAPELSEWRCELFGTGPHGMTLTPNKGNEPCWFWRWMQRLCFGNKWIKKSREGSAT